MASHILHKICFIWDCSTMWHMNLWILKKNTNIVGVRFYEIMDTGIGKRFIITGTQMSIIIPGL